MIELIRSVTSSDEHGRTLRSSHLTFFCVPCLLYSGVRRLGRVLHKSSLYFADSVVVHLQVSSMLSKYVFSVTDYLMFH